MPIAVKDYIWEESDRELFITVPLKAVKAAKVDILSTEAYIKVREVLNCWLSMSTNQFKCKESDQASAKTQKSYFCHFIHGM